MGDIMREELKDIFIGWNQKEINIAWQMIIFLRKVNVTIEEFESFAEYQQIQSFNHAKEIRNILYLRSEIFKELSRECPLCRKKMVLYPVNSSKCTQVPNKKLNSVWSCPDEKGCGEQIWNQKDAMFYIRKMEKKFKKIIDEMSQEEILELDVPRDFYKSFRASGGCGGK